MQRQAGVCEIHIIEDIEGFPAKLKAVALPRHLEGFGNSQIDIGLWGEAQNGACAHLTGKLIREAVHSAGTAEKTRVPAAIVTDGTGIGVHRNRQGILPIVRVPGVVSLNNGRQGTGEPHDAGDLPAPHNLIHPSRGISQQSLSGPERKFVDYVGIHQMPDIEI